MLSHGAYNAIEFDSGGSAEMVARLPGQAHVTVLNTPSDGSERPVADGLFLYSTETSPAAAGPEHLPDDGTIADLQYGYQELQSFGLPFHDAAGNHEIGQGAEPEDKYWATLFGNTHYTYTDGAVQFAVQPVLDSIAVTAPQPNLTIGAREQLTATGTMPTGDDLAALQVPIANPASHIWSSSDPRVAVVDPSTGQVFARSPGTATISVLSGGVTGHRHGDRHPVAA